MVTTTQIENELIHSIIKLSVMSQLAKTIYVESNPAQIEYVDVNKTELGDIQCTKVVNKIKLKKHKSIIKSMRASMMIISDEVSSETITGNISICDCLSNRLDHDFLYAIDVAKSGENWAFFKQSIFSRIFSKRKNSDLINKIFQTGKNSNWIIVSNLTYSILSESKFFTNNKSNLNSVIKNVGQLRIDQLLITVYLSDSSDNNIYFGNNDSVSMVINRNLCVTEVNKKTISIEMDYEFVVNNAIKCLCLN